MRGAMRNPAGLLPLQTEQGTQKSKNRHEQSRVINENITKTKQDVRERGAAQDTPVQNHKIEVQLRKFYFNLIITTFEVPHAASRKIVAVMLWYSGLR